MGALGSDLTIGCDFNRDEIIELCKKIIKVEDEKSAHENDPDEDNWVDYTQNLILKNGFEFVSVHGSRGKSFILTGRTQISSRNDSHNHWSNVGWTSMSLDDLIKNKDTLQHTFDNFAKKFNLTLPALQIYSMTLFDC